MLLDGASDLAISPDGKNVYVAAPDSNAVAVLDRDPEDGHLTQSSGDDGCVAPGSVGGCEEGRAIDDPTSVVVSPDGDNVYVGSEGLGGGIAVFDRDPETGDLSQDPGDAGCVNETGTNCEDGLTEMVGLQRLEISPDGNALYALSPVRDAVTLYSRDAGTGALEPQPAPNGCVVRAAADSCTVAIGLGEPRALAFSSIGDGENAYLASERRDAILIFDRNGATGALTQKPGTAGCVSNTGYSDPMQAGTLGQCVNGVAMDAIDAVRGAAGRRRALRDDRRIRRRRRLRTRRRRDDRPAARQRRALSPRPGSKTPTCPGPKGSARTVAPCSRPTAWSPAPTAGTSTPRPASAASPASTPLPLPPRRRPGGRPAARPAGGAGAACLSLLQPGRRRSPDG